MALRFACLPGLPLGRCWVALAVALLGLVSLRGSWGAESPAASPLDQAVRGLEAPADEHAHEHGHAHPHGHSPGHAHAARTTASPGGPVAQGALESFGASWKLFHNSYLVGWMTAALLALVGVVVVARDQIFIGAAVSQASTLGIALALCASRVFPLHSGAGLEHSESWLCCDSFQVLLAVTFSVAAALVTVGADRARGESHEAITGWIFLISAGLSVLVVAHSPHGTEEIRRLHSSSIIGATAADVRIFALLLAVTVGLVATSGRRLLLFVTDPAMAVAVGLRVGRWALCEALWLGLVVGLSIRVSGLLFTFGCLVLPPLVAKNVCREVRWMFWVAPALTLITSTASFVLANHYDYPPAQMHVALSGALLPAAWLVRFLRRG